MEPTGSIFQKAEEGLKEGVNRHEPPSMAYSDEPSLF